MLTFSRIGVRQYGSLECEMIDTSLPTIAGHGRCSVCRWSNPLNPCIGFVGGPTDIDCRRCSHSHNVHE